MFPTLGFMRTIFLFFLSYLGWISYSLAQESIHYTTTNVHSHNDYDQAIPFYGAYAREFGSIEADLWVVDSQLYVAHDRPEISSEHTFRFLYLDPLIRQIKSNGGKAYRSGKDLQLLIDLKSPYYEVLPLLLHELEPYRPYFDRKNNPDAVRLVISGHMPPPDSLYIYDPIFTFDGRLNTEYPEENWERVILVSANVQNVVSWKRDEVLSEEKQDKLRKVIDHIHQKDKLIRFWATPNTEEAYRMLMKLGVDYIGTDDPVRIECLLRR